MPRDRTVTPSLDDLAADWPQIAPWLDRALERPQAQRLAWLDSASGLGTEQRKTLRRLLERSATIVTADFLEVLPPLIGWHPARAVDTPAMHGEARGPAPGDRVGPWRLLQALGEGGMGSVFLADRADGPLKRPVALKLPRVNWDPGLAQRLERERDILARLEHPHIARLYEAGVDDHGRPWLALEYVQGAPIDVHATERELPLRERLGLLLQVCQAVAYAHGRLVIHRDLKPNNILVTAEGQVRLLDFGIAKLLHGEGNPDTALTEHLGRALSPGYASPEQVRGETLGTATDVYSLGVVAFQLLCGKLPYAPRRPSMAAMEDAIEHEEAPLASQRTQNRDLARALSGDLDLILQQALRKGVAQRYASVDALAEDIRRHLRSETVLAQPDRMAYRMAKFVQRNRLPVAAAVVTMAALVAGTTVAWVQAVRANAERESAVMANQRALASQSAAEAQAVTAREQRSAAWAAQARAEVAAEAERLAAAEAKRQTERALQAEREARRAGQRAEIAAVREREQAVLARSEAERAQAVRDYVVGLFRTADPGQADAPRMQSMTAVQLLDRGVEQVDELAAASPAARLELLRVFANAYAGLGRFEQSLSLRRRAVVEAEAQHGIDSLPALTQRVYLARTLGLVGQRDGGLREIDTVLTALARAHAQRPEYAEALVGSAYLRQQVDPARALRDAEQAVRVYDTLADRAAVEGRQLDSVLQAAHRGALLALGVQQQTGGALRHSLATLTTAAKRSAVVVGESNMYTVNVRTRRLYSLLALGQFEDVVREAPALIEANARFAAASATLVPQVRLYHARALSALGRHADAEQAVLTAIKERGQQPNPRVSPRLDTFRGLLWVVRLEAKPQADAVRELEAMLAAGEGVASSRMLWATTLVQACLSIDNGACAKRQGALAAGMAAGRAASPEMVLQQLTAAAQLTDSATPRPQLENMLAALQTAEAAAESDHDRARSVWAQALALHRSGHSMEAAQTLRGLGALNATLKHVRLREQLDALTKALSGVPAPFTDTTTSR